MSYRQQRHEFGLELAFASNNAFDRWREAASKLQPAIGEDVDPAEIDRLFREVMPEVNQRLEDFAAYCKAAGALLLPERHVESIPSFSVQ